MLIKNDGMEYQGTKTSNWLCSINYSWIPIKQLYSSIWLWKKIVNYGASLLWSFIPFSIPYGGIGHKLQWNLSETTTTIIKFITCDLFSNEF